MKALKLINLVGLPKTICQPLTFPLTYTDLQEINAVKLAFKDAFTEHRVYTLGLAAPQIGVNKRFFVMPKNFNYAYSTNFDNMKNLVNNFNVYINPKILNYSPSKKQQKQNCLSVDQNQYIVQRPKEVQVQYYNEQGKMIQEKLDQLRSRIFQHQNDHLDGILVTQTGVLAPQPQEFRRGKMRRKRALV